MWYWTADDIDDTSTTNKFVTSVDLSLISTALQSGDNVSDLTNDANYIDAAGVLFSLLLVRLVPYLWSRVMLVWVT